MTPQSKLLTDKVVVLVGGAGLLGQSFARSTASHGAATVVADIDASRAAEACERMAASVCGGQFIPEVVDITSKDSLHALIGRVGGRFGRIDAAVNNPYPRNRHYG